MCTAVCESLFCGAAPFQEQTKAGVILSIIKRIIIGLIVTTAIVSGVYFTKMAIYHSFDMSLATKLGLTIPMACIFGLMSLAVTAGCISAAKEKWPHNEDLRV